MHFLKVLSALILTVGSLQMQAATVFDTLHINSGILENIEYNSVKIFNFNRSENFDLVPHSIQINTGDQLALVIINHDSVDHEIQIVGSDIDMSVVVLAGGSNEANISLTQRTMLLVSDTSEKYRYLGLSTMIAVVDSDEGQNPHFWNLREFNVDLIKYFDDEYPQALENYQAEYFTINNRSYPHVVKDSNVYIKGTVGEKLTIYVYNSGLVNHNLHFHGYHAQITYSSAHPNHQGRLKDSMPIDKGQFLILEVVPPQPGTFPIHNHNLGATVGTNRYNNTLGVTICGSEDIGPGDNIYPFGMLTEIEITPKK